MSEQSGSISSHCVICDAELKQGQILWCSEFCFEKWVRTSAADEYKRKGYVTLRVPLQVTRIVLPGMPEGRRKPQ
jgi:predicted nucleic acid-binding Zn ribbon protein